MVVVPFRTPESILKPIPVAGILAQPQAPWRCSRGLKGRRYRPQQAAGKNSGSRLPQSTGELGTGLLSFCGCAPMLDIRQLARDHGMTFPTADKAMRTLVDLGIAREITGRRRNRVFVYDAYLGILNEDG